MREIAIFLLIPVLVVAGCSGNKQAVREADLPELKSVPRPVLPQPTGGFVLALSDETITSEEIVIPAMAQLQQIAKTTDFIEFKRQAQSLVEQLIAAKVSNILLYQKAKEKAGDKIDEALEKAVKAETRRFILSFGGDTAKAEEALRQMGMDWASFSEHQKKVILSQSYLQSELEDKKPVTYSNLRNYYDAMKDAYFTAEAMLTFRLIDIQIDKLLANDPNKGRLEQARELAGEIIEKLNEGEDFARLASIFSHGHRREFGGLWRPVKPDSLAEPYDVLSKEAEKMQAGRIAGPIETAGHIFIMKLEEKRERTIEPFEKVQKQLGAKIRFNRRKEAVDRLTTELVQHAELSRKQEFVDFCLEQIYRKSNE